MKTLIIDNYDSFTYNLHQLIAEITGIPPLVIRHDACTFEMIEALNIDNIVISPGPGHPATIKDFGVCQEIIQKSTLPILGVCLGHQGICCAFGGRVVHAPMPIHGQISQIKHLHDPLFKDIPEIFDAVRYHSLIAEPPLPTCLEVIATTAEDGLIMGVRHRTRPIYGVQYHPESICSQYGKQLLINFNTITRLHQSHPKPASRHLGSASRHLGSASRHLGSASRHLGSTSRHLGSTSRHPERSEGSPNLAPGYHPKISREACPELDQRARHDEASIQQSRYEPVVKICQQFYDSMQVFETLYSETNPAVWLDSSRITPGVSRFSIMGCLDGPLSYLIEYEARTKTLTRTQHHHQTQLNISLFEFLNRELQRCAVTTFDYPFPFCGGFVGYFGYELFQETLPVKAKHASPYHDAKFLFLDRAIVFDHETQTCYLMALCEQGTQKNAAEWFDRIEAHLKNIQHQSQEPVGLYRDLPQGELRRDRLAYIADIKTCLHAIHAGDSYEMCLTNQFQYHKHIDSLSYYKVLRRINPAPYAAWMRFKDLAIASSSIERFLRITSSGAVESKPIKGTLPRGKTKEEDARLAETLKHHTAFKAENLMIVDLLRHDLGQVCEIGSVHVPDLMRVESYETVHQLVSTIRGQLSPGVTPIDCIRAAFPGGSMTGAPKIRTIEMLQDIEKTPRGIYSGSLGYLSLNGSVDLNIVIRTAIITDNQVTIGIGGAITALSHPEAEFEEILLKAHALQRALSEG